MSFLSVLRERQRLALRKTHAPAGLRRDKIFDNHVTSTTHQLYSGARAAEERDVPRHRRACRLALRVLIRLGRSTGFLDTRYNLVYCSCADLAAEAFSVGSCATRMEGAGTLPPAISDPCFPVLGNHISIKYST